MASQFSAQPDVADDDIGLIVESRFLDFLKRFEFSETPGSQATPSTEPRTTKVERSLRGATNAAQKYVESMKEMKDSENTTLLVDYRDLLAFEPSVAEALDTRFYEVYHHLRKAVYTLAEFVDPEFVRDESHTKEFFVGFQNLPLLHPLRELTADKVGNLISFTATVVRTSEVKPELLFGAFRCKDCAAVVENVEQQFKYTEPTICPSGTCANKRDWELLADRSIFVDWQKLRVQENSSEIPPGGMPRSMEVIIRQDIVDTAKAGNRCIFTGTVIVIPDVSQLLRPGELRGFGRSTDMEGVRGLRTLGVRNLSYKLAFYAVSVSVISSSISADDNRSFDEVGEEILAMRNTDNIYFRLSRCIAPNIYGHAEIKKGLLLMLCGGVHKESPSGLKLRGDLNICIVGDPSTAKSQFLKYVCNLIPTAVYTSGKSSTAAGLTASIVIDPETQELGIEAGALMLADKGICCIDEFDKMDINDQVTIHEAMEQQTISISKAGIHASLNARTSILAAANPVFGRYDKSKTLRQNLNISAPIMSRFDLFFVIPDDSDEMIDNRIAKHIIEVHQNFESGEELKTDFSQEQLRNYISFARNINPMITPEAKQHMINVYKKLRRSDTAGSSQQSYRITVRQLESLVRLSEAIARVYLDNQIKVQYVEEAYQLVKQSVIRIETGNIELAPLRVGEAAAPVATRVTSRAPSSAGVEGGEATVEGEEELSAPVPDAEPTVTITFDKYSRISNLLFFHLNTLEEGQTMQQLVEWYLENERMITQLEELAEEKRVVELVIRNLVEVDHVLIAENDDIEGLITVNPAHVVH